MEGLWSRSGVTRQALLNIWSSSGPHPAALWVLTAFSQNESTGIGAIIRVEGVWTENIPGVEYARVWFILKHLQFLRGSTSAVHKTPINFKYQHILTPPKLEDLRTFSWIGLNNVYSGDVRQ